MMIITRELVESFLRDQIESINQLTTTSPHDRDAWQKHLEQFYTDHFVLIRPSGNPVDREGFANLVLSEDMTDYSEQLVAIQDVRIFAEGQCAIAMYKTDQVFHYKGVHNKDRAVLSSVLELVDGSIKIAHMHRCTAEPMPNYDDAEGD